MTNTASERYTEYGRIVRRRGAVVALGLGGFLLFGGFVPLEEGVAVQGTVVAADDRKVVQHFEGGMIEALRVREGQRVEAGDVLLTLSRTASEGERDRLLYQIMTLRGSAARLEALRDGDEAMALDAVRAVPAPDAITARVIREQTDLFGQQRRAGLAEDAVLTRRIEAAEAMAVARADQARVAASGAAAARDELALAEEMLAMKMARRADVERLRQATARAEADRVRLLGEAADASAQARDLEGQLAAARAGRDRQVAQDLLDTRTQLNDRTGALGTAEDVLDRTVVRAPQSGEVLNLAFRTVGGVIRASEPIMEIVPDGGGIVTTVRVPPHERSSVFEGQSVRTRIAALDGWRAPQLEGEVLGVSADLKTDRATGAQYYEARIGVSDEEAAKVAGLKVLPGMPVEAFIFSGAKRTMLDYLLEPLTRSARRGLAAT